MRVQSLQIQPSYGSGHALVFWEPDYELAAASASYYVYSSPDGAGDWRMCNDAPLEATEFLDLNFDYSTRHRIPHYRVLAVLPDGTMIHSEPVGLFSGLSRSEYGGCHVMMKQEYLHIRTDGFPVFHYIPRTHGELASGWNPDTQENVSPCPEDPTKDSFGQKYVGGYRKPYYTVMHIKGPRGILKRDREDGLGLQDEFKPAARMLAFPRPERGHVIVVPGTDDRYKVTGVVQALQFKGVYPVMFIAQLELLRREHPAYRIPLPSNWKQLPLP